jgi:ABC-2 type transport system permease protein
LRLVCLVAQEGQPASEHKTSPIGQRGEQLSYSIETHSLTKRFPRHRGLDGLLRPSRRDEVVAVDAVTVSIKRGELFGLLGPNGAGKTTLIKLLSTLVLPTSGDALISGYPLADGEMVRRRIGLVTGEERSFYWRLSGRDNLRFYASLYGLSHTETEGRVGELASLLGLQEVLDQRFDAYSTGMKQRLALARGLLNDAEILFLDEPTRSLDPSSAARLRETIHRLVHERGHTIVLVTHQLGEAGQLCDRLGIMHRGRLAVVHEVGRLKELVRPEARYQMEIAGISEAALREFRHLDGVIELSTEALSPDKITLDVRLLESASALAEMLRRIVAEGGGIGSIRAEDVTLEEIFEKFTGNDWSGDGAGVSSSPQMPCVEKRTYPDKRPVLDAVMSSGLLRAGLRKTWAFVLRDFKLQVSYRLAFLLQCFGILFSVASFYFVALLFGQAAAPHLQAYGGDYFAFVLVGIAFMRYQGVAMSTFADTIRRGQMMGTLEAMLVTPTRLSTVLVSSSLWSFAFASLQVLIYLLLGAFLFGADLGHANLLAAVVIQVLTILAFSGIGILSASFTMVFKRGDPVNFLFGSVSTLLAGVLYPITVLPSWLSPVSYLIPLTYSLQAMRRAILTGDSLSALASDVMALLLFAAILLPMSFVAFRYAVKRAKIEGSLTQY